MRFREISGTRYSAFYEISTNAVKSGPKEYEKRPRQESVRRRKFRFVENGNSQFRETEASAALVAVTMPKIARCRGASRILPDFSPQAQTASRREGGLGLTRPRETSNFLRVSKPPENRRRPPVIVALMGKVGKGGAVWRRCNLYEGAGGVRNSPRRVIVARGLTPPLAARHFQRFRRKN